MAWVDRSGGCIDTNAQTFALLMMCLTPEDMSKMQLGPLSSYTIASLRLFGEAFGLEFKLKVDKETLGLDNDSDDEEKEMAGMKSSTVVGSCSGIGYRHMARVVNSPD